ncbi:MAG TPA: carboxypeptidase-like regulatory domain-containing protein [Anaeromyxobacteraceae bacterium]|nr:carboxypeptidase-like regulatory domain-containing protein [Anaeromyxobacteraceae bacterium]
MTTLKAIRLTLAALALSLAGAASAQNITGQVVGWVTDAETGKPIAGATVTATSPGWIPQTVRTDSRGYYVLALLPPEHYEILVEAPGFEAPVARRATVMIDWRIRNDVRLLSTARSSAAPPAEPVASR